MAEEQRNPESAKRSDGAPDQSIDVSLTGFKPGVLIGGRYEILRRLGRGGMGVVYLATDRKYGRKVALKTLLPEHTGKERAAERFEREVKLARKLDHPCIVKIYGAWRVDDLLLYTMEYVEGQSLRGMLQKKGRLGLGSTVRVLGLLCHALYYAHQYTIHRDLSPDNVMVTLDGSIKLLDFGLAKHRDNEGAFTMIGTNLGKMQYTAPEQQLNAREVDHRADIYSLGIMFYELLTGVLPQPGQIRPLRELRPDLPKQCEDFFNTATAPKPESRFQDAREFRKALKDLYDKTKNRATPPPPAVDAPIGNTDVGALEGDDDADEIIVDVRWQGLPIVRHVLPLVQRLLRRSES